MSIVRVDLAERGYDIVIENGLLDRAGKWLAPLARAERLIVVTDQNVWEAQGERLQRGCGSLLLEPIVLGAGEGAKSWTVLAGLIDRLLALGIERSDHIVAFGGGVIGDLAGFAAAIVNRGCNFVQIPTSLLAQVDSSVGGKTGINVEAGKNLVGAFHQPSLVLIDPSCLHSLPPRQVRAGYAEIAKYGLIEDAAFFGWLEQTGTAVLAGDAAARQRAIETAVAGKARIVEQDERETSGRRALLNLGHTFGHALEAKAGYSDRLLHGEAVAMGIVLAFDFSAERGLCPTQDAARVRTHLQAVGLPVSMHEVGIAASGATMLRHMMRDKKKRDGQLPFVLVRGIGQAFLDTQVALPEVEYFLDRQG